MTKIQTVLLGADLSVSAVELDADRTLDGMYRAIGCRNVDCVSSGRDRDPDFWIDDEGRLNGSAPNILASVMARIAGCPASELYGNVLVTNHDAEGNTTGLSPDQVVSLMSLARLIHQNVPLRVREAVADEAEAAALRRLG